VWSGSVYVVVGVLAKEKAIEIHTADSSFYVLDKGIYRIDAKENQNTQIFVFNGLIEAAGEQGSNLVKSGQKIEVQEGRFTSKPSNFVAAADDSFDLRAAATARAKSVSGAVSFSRPTGEGRGEGKRSLGACNPPFRVASGQPGT
jgi:hypothetical protein